MPQVRRSSPLLLELAVAQFGVLTRQQALSCGLSDSAIRHRLMRGVWKQCFSGVYMVEDDGFASTVWAALLACGANSIASHETAAHLLGLSGDVTGRRVHVMVPDERRLDRKNGIVVHRTRHLDQVRRPGSVPTTRSEDTVIS